MAKDLDKDSRAQKARVAGMNEMRRRRAAIVKMGKEHDLTNSQLAALRACNSIMGPKVSQADAIQDLVKMKLVEQKLGGYKVTTKGKATLAVNKRTV